MKGDFLVYRSGILFKGWRWKFVANNGRIIYASTESYVNFRDCVDSIPTLAGEEKRYTVL